MGVGTYPTGEAQVEKRFASHSPSNVISQSQVHRKFPKTESLWDCMQRSIPFYTQRIVPEAVNKGKRVLITSHENAIRGILMHLCEIPEEAMSQLHLPNGLPLVSSNRYWCRCRCTNLSGILCLNMGQFSLLSRFIT